MKTSINLKRITRTTGILLTGLLLGWLFFGGTPADQAGNAAQDVSEANTGGQDATVYTCSMHPSVRQPEQGKCPICAMDLIPADQASSEEEESAFELKMTEAATKLAQVQTTEVVRDVAVKKIRMPGKVVVDERRIRNLPAHYPGRIEQLYVNFTGEYVTKHEKIASIYSPALISAQKELLEAAKHKEQNPSLYRAAKNKLLNWKIPENKINEIERSGEVKTQFDITSHMGGYVTKRNIAVGDHVEMGSVMYQMADLSKVWVMFDAYESDLAGLQEGDKVSFTTEVYPGETFEAEVTYIDPIMDDRSRTANVRAEAQNPERRLKPQMLAEGIISSPVAGGQEQILVPKSAVLWTGERSVVYVQKPDTDQPTFEFREVVLGQRVGDRYVIKSGLQPGEEVVTHGNFKIDSAAQLADKVSMMNKDRNGSTPTEPDISSEEIQTTKADTSEHQYSEHLPALLDIYLEIKKALANDKYEEAGKWLGEFRTEVTQGNEMDVHPQHGAAHEKHRKAMLEAINEASKAENIEQLRLAFAGISDNLIKAVQNKNYGEQELYLQYCPMAKDNEGAYWIGATKKVSNPYMGEKMLRCGSTEKVL